MVYCGNNAYSGALKANGGHDLFGTHHECFKKGYARGLHQQVIDVHKFLQKWSGKYKAHINQKLWHSDDPVPPGYQSATLSQTMQRGYALGSIALAKQFSRKSSHIEARVISYPGRETLAAEAIFNTTTAFEGDALK